LLTRRATLDLLNVDGLDDLLGRVRQTLMFAGLADTRRSFELAESMDAGYAAMVREVGEASPTSVVADVFLLPIEWQAFRACLRAEALGHERRGVSGSAVPHEIWAQCWASDEVEPPFELFAAAAQAIRAAMPREERDERLVEEITDIYEARDLMRAALETRSDAIATWVATWLRLRLALALLRCRFNGWGHVRHADALDDLAVGKQEIISLVSPERRDWRTPLAQMGLRAIQTVPEDDPLPTVTIERLIDDAITELCHAGRGVPFGPELVFAFLWGLRCEALNLRLVVTGAAAGLPREAIARDIRQTYV